MDLKLMEQRLAPMRKTTVILVQRRCLTEFGTDQIFGIDQVESGLGTRRQLGTGREYVLRPAGLAAAQPAFQLRAVKAHLVFGLAAKHGCQPVREKTRCWKPI